MMQSLKEVIMRRDGLSSDEADELIDEAKEAARAGADRKNFSTTTSAWSRIIYST